MKLINDSFQNRKVYNILKAQLIIADIPYNIGKNAYGSSPKWYVGGDNKNGESQLAGKQFFDSDSGFNLYEFFHFASRMLKKEPKEKGQAGCMVVFCSFEQQFTLIEAAKKQGFSKYINLIFRKNFSPQVLKANMRIVGNCEYAIVFYRNKLPKFNNVGEDGRKHMIMNCMDWVRDNKTPKIHPTQKPIQVIERLIEIFTDPGDVVIDPVAGSGVTLLAAEMLGRDSYGFEIKKEYCTEFEKKLATNIQKQLNFDEQ